MGSSGGTTGTTVSGGAVVANIAEPLAYTHLSLNRYAKIMQISPAHFNGLASATIFPLTNRCSDVWKRYDWQSPDSVSWESLNQAILEAERNIKDYLRYSVAPEWTVELLQWPSIHRRDSYAVVLNAPITLGYDYLISPGVRAVELIKSAAAIAYSDADGDGFNELATITAPTTLTAVTGIKAYVSGKSGAIDWELRPIRSKAISAGTLTIQMDAVYLTNPDLQSLPPTSDGEEALDLLDATNYLTTLDIYREYSDTTVTTAELYWRSTCNYCGGIGCQACYSSTQTGCARVMSSRPALVEVNVATYDVVQDAWYFSPWGIDLPPEQVKVWYYAGQISDRYKNGHDYDPLDQSLAQCIAWLATARLERPFCNCGTATALANRLMMDMAVTEGDVSKNIAFEELDNPFGTRLGELWAYRRLRKLLGKPLGGYAV